MIITIVGGGSTFTAGIVKSIALRKDELEVDEIRLFDLDAERQDKVAVVVKWVLDEELKSGIKLTTTTDVETAYKDADFIFAQMRVGKYALRELDDVYQTNNTQYPFKPIQDGTVNECFGTSTGSLGSAVQFLGDKKKDTSLNEQLLDEKIELENKLAESRECY